jgi:hypothetical protein
VYVVVRLVIFPVDEFQWVWIMFGFGYLICRLGLLNYVLSVEIWIS